MEIKTQSIPTDLSIKEVTSKGQTFFIVGDMKFATKDLAQHYIDTYQDDDGEDYDVNDEIEFRYDSEERNPSFKRFLSEKILEKNISISSLASDLGVSRQAIYNWMDGNALPAKDKVEEIAKIFGIESRNVWRELMTNFRNAYPDFFAAIVPTQEEFKLLITDILGRLEKDETPHDLGRTRTIHGLKSKIQALSTFQAYPIKKKA